MTWSVVVPTCRSERFSTFIKAWDGLFSKHDVTLFVVQDLPNESKEIAEECSRLAYRVHLDSRRTIKTHLIPHGTDMIRSWGIYRAWQHSWKYTLTLDDDVLPDKDPFEAYERVFQQGAVVSPYFSVGALTTSLVQMRGFPFRDRVPRQVAVQYGGWDGVLDYDAPTQLGGVKDRERFLRLVMPVPKGVPVTGCIMNAAWRTEYAPIMWQLPMQRVNGKGLYNRFGDIWAGLFAKKTLDAVNLATVVNGEATVRHERASDPVANLEKEAPGIPLNEGLWESLSHAGGTLVEVYRSVTDSASDYFSTKDTGYAKHFLNARNEWLSLF